MSSRLWLFVVVAVLVSAETVVSQPANNDDTPVLTTSDGALNIKAKAVHLDTPELSITDKEGQSFTISSHDEDTVKNAVVLGLKITNKQVDVSKVPIASSGDGIVTVTTPTETVTIDSAASGAVWKAMTLGHTIGQTLDDYPPDLIAQHAQSIKDLDLKAKSTQQLLEAAYSNLSITQQYLKGNATQLAEANAKIDTMTSIVQDLEASAYARTTFPDMEEALKAHQVPGMVFKEDQWFGSDGQFQWVKPEGVSMIRVYVTGGGGGGGSHDNNDGHGGGGAGGTCIKLIDVTDIDSVSVTVGAGGIGMAGARCCGGAEQVGGTSKFGSFCTGYGGRGVRTWGVGGYGGEAEGGDLNLFGGMGHTGNVDNAANSEIGGNGGDSYWGGGGAGASYWGNRRPGRFGGGGAGNNANRPDTSSTGNGGDGVVYIEMYGRSYDQDRAFDPYTVQFGSNLETKATSLMARLFKLKNSLNISKDSTSTASAGLISTKWYDTAGNKVYTKPANVDYIRVYATGGGAGGGGHNTDDAQGGGGAGGTCIKLIHAPDALYRFTIGKGGVGSSSNCASCGGDGQTTAFGPCVARGGQNVPTWGVGGSGGVASGGDINIVGGNGHGGNIDGRGNEEAGGNGGDSFWGGGGVGSTYWGSRSPGKYGSGGGGMHASRGGNGNGGDGVVMIEEFSNGQSAPRASTSSVKNTNGLGGNIAPLGTAFGSGSSSACTSTGPTNGQGQQVSGISCIKNINDGKFGNANSWIGNAQPYKGKVFGGVIFKEPMAVNGFAVSRDNTGTNTDRNAGGKQVQFTEDPNPSIDTTSWTDFGDVVQISAQGTQSIFKTTQVVATAVRIVMANADDAIDELQVFGSAALSTNEKTTEGQLAYVRSQLPSVGRSIEKLGAPPGLLSGLGSMQVFDKKGAATWIRPKGCVRIRVFVTGGGAGGGSHNSDDAHGGGGAGGTAIKIIDVRNTPKVDLVVGAGGLGALGNRQAAPSESQGTRSSFLNVIGEGGRSVVAWGRGGYGGLARGGDVNLVGGSGHNGNIDGYANSERGGNGGDSYWGKGGGGATNWGNRFPGRYGSGGGGDHANRPDSKTAGKGGDGVIVIEEYY